MIVLAVKTDNPLAGIALYKNDSLLAAESWQAHTTLTQTLHSKVREILNKSSISLDELNGIIFYRGPGSFTGLRIGAAVANTLAYSLGIPIVDSFGKEWEKMGLAGLAAGKNQKIVLPKYGQPVHTSKPVK